MLCQNGFAHQQFNNYQNNDLIGYTGQEGQLLSGDSSAKGNFNQNDQQISQTKFKKTGNSTSKTGNGVKLEMNDKTLKLFRHFIDPNNLDKVNGSKKNSNGLIGADG